MLNKAVVAVRWVLFTGQVLGFGGVTAYDPSTRDSPFVKTFLYSGAMAVGEEALKNRFQYNNRHA
jgi:hypothetical protein